MGEFYPSGQRLAAVDFSGCMLPELDEFILMKFILKLKGDKDHTMKKKTNHTMRAHIHILKVALAF